MPIAHVTCQLVNMLLSFLVVFAVILVTGYGINPAAVFYLPVIIFVEYLLALGLTMLASAVTVFLRDIEYILGILMMAWQFLSPVMYGVDIVPEEVRPVFAVNPMTPVLAAYRDIFYYKKVPDISTLVRAVMFGAVVLIIGVLVFEYLKKHFSEEM